MERFDNPRGDVKAKTDPLSVLLLGGLQKPKELEQLSLIFLADANSSIFNTYLDKFLLLLDQLAGHCNLTTARREFEGIRQKVQKDLNHPLLIAEYDVVFVVLDV